MRHVWYVPIYSPPREQEYQLRPNHIEVRIEEPGRSSRSLRVVAMPIQRHGNGTSFGVEFPGLEVWAEPMPRRRPTRTRQLAAEVEAQLARRSGPVWDAVLTL